MSLATRCPACGTVFRVVSDQLKVSDGWVRCGRCSEVFNAAQRLFELEAGATQDRQAAVVHHLPVRDDAAASPAVARVNTALAPQSAEILPLSGVDRGTDGPADAEPAAESVPAAPAEPPAPMREASPAQHAAAPEPEPEPPPEPEPGPMPEFIRRADRAEHWRHPARRRLLGGVALLLAALLAGQMALHYRDTVAATWPATRPALQAACTALGCRIEAPRRIDALHVDSSGLVRLQDSPLYSLSLVVQNKAATVVRMPAIDLALTDAQGQTVVRRVFTAAELGHPLEQLPAGGELALQATLDLGERGIAGYTVELFYP
jgi:predicted Zn finger-like uncharacterized protein